MRRHVIVCAVAVFALAGVAATISAHAGRAAGGSPLVLAGSSNFASSANGIGGGEFAGQSDFRPESEAARESTASGASKFWQWWHKRLPASVPAPASDPVASAGGEAIASFEGLDHYDQRTANGGNQYSLEPPDQGLCTGNGSVIEAVNDVMSVYSATGTRSPVVDLNTFFGLPDQLNRTTPPGVAGDFLSDPKCYFDTDTQRFFLTILQEDPAPSVRTHTLIAVSKTSNPLGDWWIYSLDTTDDGLNGTPSHPTCPCFGDQPLIGADRNGFYVTTNEFSSTSFNGAQIYALSKSALESGTVPALVHIENPPLAESVSYSVQPATSPTAASYNRLNGGTEYFLSSLDFTGTVDNRIAAWALTNTSSLASAHPNVHLQNMVMPSENYGQPVPADQKDGPHPFGEWGANYYYGGALNQPVNTLNTNDDRMNQVVYADGFLWGGVNTVVSQGSTSKAGIAWFKVLPLALPFGKLMLAGIVRQGYVSVAGQNVLFPSIGVTPAGKAVMSMTLSGPSYYPSAAYSVFDGSGFDAVKVASAGVGPADGYTGYDPFAPDGVERWGDYSAAVSAPDGTVWAATEYIAQSCVVATYQADSTCGGTRTLLANWSTRLTAVRP
jgi:hypothetical protein